MEYLLGPALAIAMSFGYTEVRMRKHQKEYEALVVRVETMEKGLSTQMLAAMMPISRSLKELQEFTGIR
jgi:hypothetical protein|tara:strand:- start:120 stop:326 length:207 start_codon:yes stop_codon:yes gene_type:complete